MINLLHITLSEWKWLISNLSRIKWKLIRVDWPLGYGGGFRTHIVNTC